MSIEEKMTIDERRKYLRMMQKRHLRANRQERGRLLDEMEAVTELHHKSLIRLMGHDLERRPHRRQRGRSYGPEVDDALRVIAESTDFICAERLTPNLPWLARHLAAHGELEASPSLLEHLERISVSTVSRILKRIRQDEPRLRRCQPTSAHPLIRQLPMKRIPWQEKEPGHFETDLVHHCGPSASGEYVCTIQMVDVTTGWSERVAVLDRSYLVMADGFQRILARLPFPVREIHPDNGSEFCNHHLLRFWNSLEPKVLISRSRPYHKNDNRFVEQKNSTLVRAKAGYDRYDTVAQTLAINLLYDKMWLYYNFFQPVMHLSDKSWVQSDGHPPHLKRRYDQARTPFDRLCESEAISPSQRQRLEALRDQTNPRQLRQEIYALIDAISSLPDAAPHTTKDVRLTLRPAASSLYGNDHLPSPLVAGSGKMSEGRTTRPVTLSFD